MTVCSILGGTGALGAALAQRLAQAGNDVRIGSRNLDKATAVADSIRARFPTASVTGSELIEAVRRGDIVFLTVPYAAHGETLRLVAPHLTGKILIDATVPLRPPKVGTVQLPAAGAAALEARSILGGDVRIVSALQTIGAEKLASGDPIDCDVLASGDDAEAVEELAKLLGQIGLRTWHVGPLANAAAAEALTSVLIQINRRYKIAQAGIRITGRRKDAPAAATGLSILPIAGLPMLQEGDDLAGLITQAIEDARLRLEDGDVIVVAQKVVSKVEGRTVVLSSVAVTPQSTAISAETGKAPQLVELIRKESETLMRVRPGLIVARHRLGHVIANAGIDASNVASPEGRETVVLWPKDPDASARQLRTALQQRFGVRIAVIVSDSIGRAWRMGTMGTAIGAAGLKPVRDRRGEADLFGRTLQATIIGVADEIAAAASLVMGEAAEGIPAAIVRGATYDPCEDSGIGALLRPREEDLFL